MKRYRVDYMHLVEHYCFAYVNASSSEEAIELVKNCDASVDYCENENFPEVGIECTDYSAEVDE